ncbi:MAG: endonuclease III [Candidatus Eremiobacteraeota bacterium]|nr:endonuclease III [Candidatus Eremiobacteraeota bacterium]
MRPLERGTMERKYAAELMARLERAYPHARTALHYGNPLEMLVATILSAQCTDERVNMVTPGLFKKYRRPSDYYGAAPEELESDIHSTGFYRNKAKSIQGAARMIDERFGGKVPDSMEKLLELPGVARKTANCVLGNAYGIASGIVVDTHVLRLSGRLGLSDKKNADKIEGDLMKIVPGEKWIDFSHWLVEHGRAVCKARKPLCGKCMLSDICPSPENTVRFP